MKNKNSDGIHILSACKVYSRRAFPKPTNQIEITCDKQNDTGERAASAVINFPRIDGEDVLFIHEFQINPNCGEQAEIIFNWILNYAKRYHFKKIYAYRRKVEEAYLLSKGFQINESTLLLLERNNG